MLSAEQLLEQAAKDGSMVPEEWPRALRFILPRLQDIVHNQFPMPTAPESRPEPARDRSATPSKLESTGEASTTGKENAPSGEASSGEGSGSQQADGDAQTMGPPSPSRLPPEINELYTSIVFNLNRNFPQHPPHTLQRLAELVLSPKAHYRFLPPYLRALDRVVTVSSTTTVFPLPQAIVPSSGSTILNGVTPGTANMSPPSRGSTSTLGSDDSLGGALLTPIPWLSPSNGSGGSELVSESTEMVDGPNGAGRIETVSVVNGVLGTTTSMPAASAPATSSSTATSSDTPSSASGSANSGATATAPDALRDTGPVTQGELLRQEQEAGIVTVPAGGASGTSSRPVTRSSGLLQQSHQQDQQSEQHTEGEPMEEAEAPHARGPDVIGMEDMGPQQGGGLARGIDLEAAVGRPAPHPEKSGEDAQEDEGVKGENKDQSGSQSREEEMKDASDEPENKDSGSSEQESKDAVNQAGVQGTESMDIPSPGPMFAPIESELDMFPTSGSGENEDEDWEMLSKNEGQAEDTEPSKEEETGPEKEQEGAEKKDDDAKESDSTTSEDAAGETDKKDDVEQPKKNKDEDEQMGGCGTSA
ncbi:hypothetical protein IWZ00DRAFT_510969 [Phyllosticta capitalensis]